MLKNRSMELFGDFPEFLKPHIAEAYMAALRIADPEDISLLRAPYSELLFGRFYEMTKGMRDDQKPIIEHGFHGTSPDVLNSILTFGMLDPTSIKYKVKNGNTYGPGVYISTCPKYSRSYARQSGGICCMLIVLMIKGCDIKSADQKGITLETDNVQAGNIVVLRSTSQVLPVFVCKKLLNSFKLPSSSISMFTLLPGKNGESKPIWKIIEELHEKITFDEGAFSIALDIQQKYISIVKDESVKISLIYNLILKFADGKSITDPSVINQVMETLMEYDLS